MKMKLLLITTIIFLFLWSCVKSPVDPELQDNKKETIIPETTKLISVEDVNRNLISISADSTIFSFNSSVNNTYNFKKDDIIVIPSGGGFLKKIRNVQKSGNNIIISTQQATIAEAIEKGKLTYRTTLSKSQIKKINYYGRGIHLDTSKLGKLNETNFEFNINKVLYDRDGDDKTESDQIKLVGNFGLITDIIFEIDINWFSLDYVKYGFETNNSGSLALLASIDYSLEKEISLAHITFTPIYLQIGPVPVIITPELNVKVGIEGYAYASFTTSIEQSFNYQVGIEYKKADGWGTYDNLDNTFNFSPPQLSAGVSARAYIKPEIGMFVYSVLGAYSSASLYSEILADINKTPWWSLYLGMDIGVGAKAKIHSWELFDFNKNDVITYRHLLAQAETSVNTTPTASFTITPPSGNLETIFYFDASNSIDNEDPTSNLEVRWDWENDGNWDTEFNTEKKATHMFSLEGSYTVLLEVKDTGGLTDIEGISLEIIDSPPITDFNFLGTLNGHNYYLSNGKKLWLDAQDDCLTRGGHLVTISDETENDIVKKSFDFVISGVWIGFSDHLNEGTWVWVTGEPITYDNWNSGEPNNNMNNEDFAYMVAVSGLRGKWNDGGNNSEGYYVMEVE